MGSRRYFVILLVIALNTAALEAQLRCPLDTRAHETGSKFVVSGSITMPIGAFLLVRKNGQLGAIRLTSIDPSGSEWLGKFSYESYFQSDPLHPLTTSGAIKHSGPLEIAEPKGIHAVYLYGGGNHRAKVGRWSFTFNKPNMISLTDSTFWDGSMKDHGFEFAPTSACDVSEIDASDKRLKWYPWVKYDSDRPAIELPLAVLAK